MQRWTRIALLLVVMASMPVAAGILRAFPLGPDQMAARRQLHENPPQGYRVSQNRFDTVWDVLTSLTMDEINRLFPDTCHYIDGGYAIPSFAPICYAVGGCGFERTESTFHLIEACAPLEIFVHHYQGGATHLCHALYFRIDDDFVALIRNVNPSPRIRWEEARLARLEAWLPAAIQSLPKSDTDGK